VFSAVVSVQCSVFRGSTSRVLGLDFFSRVQGSGLRAQRFEGGVEGSWGQGFGVWSVESSCLDRHDAES
jgi:hypothetical protein